MTIGAAYAASNVMSQNQAEHLAELVALAVDSLRGADGSDSLVPFSDTVVLVEKADRRQIVDRRAVRRGGRRTVDRWASRLAAAYED